MNLDRTELSNLKTYEKYTTREEIKKNRRRIYNEYTKRFQRAFAMYTNSRLGQNGEIDKIIHLNEKYKKLVSDETYLKSDVEDFVINQVKKMNIIDEKTITLSSCDFSVGNQILCTIVGNIKILNDDYGRIHLYFCLTPYTDDEILNNIVRKYMNINKEIYETEKEFDDTVEKINNDIFNGVLSDYIELEKDD